MRGEFTSVEFEEHCTTRGLQWQLSTPYSPQQSGVVERRNETIVGMVRSMMKAKGVLGYFLGEAVSTAVHILNRALTRMLDGKTPYEAWHGERPTVHYFRTFGYIMHIKTTWPGLKKLDDRSTPMILIGYEPGARGYRCYNSAIGRVAVSRDVVFDEAARWECSAEDGSGHVDDEPFIIEYTTEYVISESDGSVGMPSCQPQQRFHMYQPEHLRYRQHHPSPPRQ